MTCNRGASDPNADYERRRSRVGSVGIRAPMARFCVCGVAGPGIRVAAGEAIDRVLTGRGSRPDAACGSEPARVDLATLDDGGHDAASADNRVLPDA